MAKHSELKLKADAIDSLITSSSEEKNEAERLLAKYNNDNTDVESGLKAYNKFQCCIKHNAEILNEVAGFLNDICDRPDFDKEDLLVINTLNSTETMRFEDILQMIRTSKDLYRRLYQNP